MAGARWPCPDAGRLLRELGIDDPRELDVEAIAQHCGATIVYEPLHGCEARLAAWGDRAIVTVDEAASYHRRRFSAAHELAHWMLDRRRKSFACTREMIGQGWQGSYGRGRVNAFEKRANRWAADLLMPERLFKPMIADEPLILDTARNLTRAFRTSFFATALRLVRFGRDASMLIRSRPGQRWKWFYRSPGMPSAVWPLDEPGEWTVAYRLLRGDREDSGPQLVEWDHWLDVSSVDSVPTYYLREDSMLMQSGEVLSLLWFDDKMPLWVLQDAQPPHRRGWVGDRG